MVQRCRAASTWADSRSPKKLPARRRRYGRKDIHFIQVEFACDRREALTTRLNEVQSAIIHGKLLQFNLQ